MSEHASLRAKEQAHAEAHARRSGYTVGGGVSDEIASAVHKHERHDHKGEPLTALRSGGRIGGAEPRARPDRHARGGGVKGKGPAKVNIVIATGGGEGERRMAFQQGTQVGAKLAAAAPRPPMMPPPGMGGVPPGMGGPPPGAMPPPPGAGMPPRPPMGPGMAPGMKRGGGIYPIENAGSGGARARLQKAGMEDRVSVAAHTRRKAGGRV